MPPPAKRMADGLFRVLLILAFAHVAAMLVVVLGRIAYPFELEWMEGAILDHVVRLLHGQPLYVRPSLDFVSYNYPPLYYAVSAAVAKVTGVGFLPLRLVSFLSSLGCLAILFAWARKESGSAAAGFLSAAFFAAAFKVGGAWFDIARVDMLALFLVLAAAWLLRHGGRGIASAALAGVLIAAAGLTKQLALAALLPLLLVTLVARRPNVWVAAGIAALLTVAATLWLNQRSGGWYLYFTFDLPRRLPMAFAAVGDFWAKDMLGTAAFACAIVGLYVIGRWTTDRAAAGLDLALLAGLFGVAWAARLPVGGFSNVLLPAYAGVALFFGPAVKHMREAARSATGPAGKALEPYLLTLCIVQFLWLGYNPASQIPTRASRDAGVWLVNHLRDAQGDVLLAYHGYIATLAGKPPHAHWMSVSDVVRFDAKGEGAHLEAEIRQAARAHKFAAVLLDQSKWMAYMFEADYTEAGTVFDPTMDNDFWPVTGLRTRPQYLFVPASTAPK